MYLLYLLNVIKCTWGDGAVIWSLISWSINQMSIEYRSFCWPIQRLVVRPRHDMNILYLPAAIVRQCKLSSVRIRTHVQVLNWHNLNKTVMTLPSNQPTHVVYFDLITKACYETTCDITRCMHVSASAPQRTPLVSGALIWPSSVDDWPWRVI